jgi:hypothetical protein
VGVDARGQGLDRGADRAGGHEHVQGLAGFQGQVGHDSGL